MRKKTFWLNESEALFIENETARRRINETRFTESALIRELLSITQKKKTRESEVH